jgi:hypothetical protein
VEVSRDGPPSSNQEEELGPLFENSRCKAKYHCAYQLLNFWRVIVARPTTAVSGPVEFNAERLNEWQFPLNGILVLLSVLISKLV